MVSDFTFHTNKEAIQHWIAVDCSGRTLQKGVTKLASPSELLSHSHVKINRRNEAGMC